MSLYKKVETALLNALREKEFKCMFKYIYVSINTHTCTCKHELTLLDNHEYRHEKEVSMSVSKGQ